MSARHDIERELEALAAQAGEQLRKPSGTAAWSKRRERAFVARVLARTTREDLGWRGELRLVSGFVRDRLRDSRTLRVLAASLLLHIVVVPTLALMILREKRQDEVRLGIEPQGWGEVLEAPIELAEEPGQADETANEGESLEADGSALEPGPDRIDNALRRDRFRLARIAVPTATFAVADDAALEIALLASRSRWLTDRAWTSLLDDPRTVARCSPAERALYAEVLLDRFALTGERPATLTATLSALARDEAPANTARRLAAGTLDRARAYGLWEAPAGFDPERSAAVLAPEWRALLGAYLDETGAEGAVADAWRAWGAAGGGR